MLLHWTAKAESLKYPSNSELSIPPTTNDKTFCFQEHTWFRGVRWDMLQARMVKPPFVPKLLSDDDTSNFDDYDNVEEDQGAKVMLTPQQQKLFKDF